jgi:hypothetical protein
VPTIGVYSATYVKFPNYDGFVAYYNPGAPDVVRVFGFQAKLGRAYPKSDVDDELVMAGFVLRGSAPAAENIKKGWVYMSAADVKDFLGFSLSFLYPANLLDLPPSTEDLFD